MSPQLRGIGFTGPQQQRGAIGLMAAVTLGMVLLFMLLVVDSGRLYLEQRKLQRVADMAVLEAVSRGGTCGLTLPNAQSLAEENAKRNNFIPGGAQQIATACGTLETNATTQVRKFKEDTKSIDAIQVIATTIVPTSVAGGLWSMFSKDGFSTETNLAASAVGSNGGSPLAQLTIRSSLINISDKQSSILNPLIGGMLGGSLSLNAVSWNGLLDTKISLLSYLNTLLDLNTTIGSTDELLNTNLHLSQLLDAIAINVLKKNGPSAKLVIDNLAVLSALPSSSQLLKLGELLNIKNGTPSAGLNTEISIFDLLQGVAQLSNSKNFIDTHLTTSLTGIAKIDIYTKVIEPPQISAIGNPALINGRYDDPNKISVRTAQIQTRIHLDLPIVQALQPLTDLITNALSTVLEIVKRLLKLDLKGLVECVFSCKAIASLTLVPALDIYVEVARAESHITSYSCATNSKTLDVLGSTALAKISIGSPPKTGTFPPTDPTSSNHLKIEPIKLININLKTCTLVVFCPTGDGDGGSLNLKAQASLAETAKTLKYESPHLLDIGQPPYYQSFGIEDIIDSVANTLDGHVTTSYTPPVGKTVTGDLLNTVSEADNTLTLLTTTAFKEVLSSLLDPLINTLLKALGITLGNADVGANLSCNQGGRAQLVL